MTKKINLASTGLRRYARLTNKPKKKYCLFAKLSLSVIGACEVDNNPNIFLTRENQHIQEINRHFDGTLNHFGPIIFVANQEQNQSYTFKDMLLQPDNSYLILTMIKELEAHEARIHWTLTKNSKVNNKHKINMGISRLFYSFVISSARDSHM